MNGSIPRLQLKAGMNVWVTMPMGKAEMMFASGIGDGKSAQVSLYSMKNE